MTRRAATRTRARARPLRILTTRSSRPSLPSRGPVGLGAHGRRYG
jgi:hypothetical protein